MNYTTGIASNTNICDDPLVHFIDIFSKLYVRYYIFEDKFINPKKIVECF